MTVHRAKGHRRCGIPEPNHDHKLDASTDTPQIDRGPDWLHQEIREDGHPVVIMTGRA